MKSKILIVTVLMYSSLSFGSPYTNQGNEYPYGGSYPNENVNYPLLIWSQQQQQLEVQRQMLREQERQQRIFEEERKIRLMQESFR